MMWLAVAALFPAVAAAEPVGQFIDHRDIGKPASPGAASYDPASATYRITGVGRNMWADHDDFHFAWKRMSGDVVAETRLDFLTPAPKAGEGGFLHRKGGIVLRQDLDPDSAYVDVLRMGNHQMSLQYRAVKGGPTRLIWINTARQDAVRLVKIGDYAYLSTLGPDGKLHPAGGSFKLRISGSYYIGLGVCPHDDVAHETMAFRDVRIAQAPRHLARPSGATLQTIHVDTIAEQTVIYHSDRPIALTGWSPDSQSLTFANGGVTRRAVAWDSDKVETIRPGAPRPGSGTRRMTTGAIGIAQRLSPDGKWLAYLTGEPGRAPSADQDLVLRVVPMIDGAPVIPKSASLVSLWGNASSLPPAAWAPDGKTLAFISRD